MFLILRELKKGIVIRLVSKVLPEQTKLVHHNTEATIMIKATCQLNLARVKRTSLSINSFYKY